MPKVIDLETHRQLLSDMNRLRQRLKEYSLSNDMLGVDAARHLDEAYDSMQGDLPTAKGVAADRPSRDGA